MIDTLVYDATSHLVQSTLFAGAAALLTLAFRANRAAVRFWLWLSASLKFLIPFAVLSMAGSHIGAWAPASPLKGIGATVPTFSFAEESFRHSSPYTAWGVAPSAHTRSIDPATLDQVVVVVWLPGVFSVALIRLRGWRRIRLLIRASVSTVSPRRLLFVLLQASRSRESSDGDGRYFFCRRESPNASRQRR